MNKLTTLRFITLVTLGLILSTPTHSFAGGGQSSKSNTRTVRIKNISTAATTPPSTTLSTVEVGDAGNTPVTIGEWSYGQVNEAYRIGKYEVTIKQYADFLNSIATRPDTYSYGSAVVESLYDSRMASDTNVAGISRSGDGTAASPYSYTVIGDGRRPITYVTWLNAARFANWMHNGALSTSQVEFGAYGLHGATSGTFTKQSDAKWWIPSEDEWFKAAYYKGGGTNAGYFLFPTKSDTLPANSSSATADNANFLRLGVYAVTQSATLSATENYLTPVGDFINSAGPYGTFDQGGNVDEWTSSTRSTSFGVAYVTRGGAWNTGGLNNDATPESTALPTDRSNKIGFRLARLATEEDTPTLSGTFEIAVKESSAPPKLAQANTVVQFAVKKGAFTIVATDPVFPSLTSEQTFDTSTRRNTFITVNNSGGAITFALSGESF